MTKYINRENILINHIIEKRKQSALTIQAKFRKHMKRQIAVSFAKKNQSYYSVYPSFLIKQNPKSRNNLKIKIFKDLNAPSTFSVHPVKFCPVRNCYVFDIQKNKFSPNNKRMNFVFISRSDKVVLDPTYKIIQLGDELINQVNFQKFDNNNQNNNYLNFSFDEKESLDNNSNSFSGIADNSESEKYGNLSVKNCLNLNLTPVNKCNSSKIDLLSNTFSSSTKDSIHINSPASRRTKKRRAKSILKNKNGRNSCPKYKEIRSISKKVSFGMSQITFYKCKIKY
jgi:hypothetical protein